MLDLSAVRDLYVAQSERHALGRRRLGRPLTLTEKVLFSHLFAPESQPLERRRAFLALRPDRVAMQDATAQMALLQYMVADRAEVALPSTVHCDHLVRAHTGAADDLPAALDENAEVFAFLESVCARYGIGFWRPGSGIIHQVVLENHAFPGGLLIGTDSHTVNAGGLGMLAVGVGGADAVDAMVGLPWEVLHPGAIAVRLTGRLRGWAGPKDVILRVCELLTVSGATNSVVEYLGPGCEAISCTGKATICNMGAEHGATASIFPFDERMAAWLSATGREEVAVLARAHAAELRADPEVEAHPERFFDRVLEIDLDALEPRLVGPHTPDLGRALGEMGSEADARGWQRRVTFALIGSCTNSSYEDLSRCASVVRQATAAGLRAKTGFLVTPGSDQILATIERDGIARDLRAAGAVVLANACGPCIGQWKRDDVGAGAPNTIVTSFNRNFRGRNDANPETLAFVGSPEVVTAIALAGDVGFDPRRDAIPGPGGPVVLEPPRGEELPAGGFVFDRSGWVPPRPAGERGVVAVVVDPASERLERLAPFEPWGGADFSGLRVLVKVAGKCTTDHISPAGRWLRYRGHLTRISGNLLVGATNAFTGEVGVGMDFVAGGKAPHPDIARHYRAVGQRWVVVGDHNYGEGSSREHAAMEPRHMGCAAVIVRSFARIHETNLKKQGLLPLTFADPADYDKVRGDDVIDIVGIEDIQNGGSPVVILRHSNGTVDEIPTCNSVSPDQFDWFRAGSALNHIRSVGQR